MSLAAETLATRATWHPDVPALRHAAAEFGTHVARIPGEHSVPVGLVAGGPGLAPGEFEVTVAPAALTIRGESRRAVLDGVYWLLERLGFAWVAPGPRGDAFLPGLSIPEGTHRAAPGFASRTLILGQDALHDEWMPWMEWASRNRLNGIFFHDTPPSRLARSAPEPPASAEARAADGGSWMFERWNRDGRGVREAADARAMALQFGGHHLPGLLPRAYFAAHPDWFPERGGRRDPRYNLCVSSEGAREAVRQSARVFFRRFPGADRYHAWADDIRGGGWCGCPGCRALSPSEQAMTATNLLAEALAEVEPGARVAHLAYRDTLGEAARVRPADNVVLLWAPRERCYGHAIDDPGCSRNARYFARFRALTEAFGRDPARVSVFEYYSDAILFKGLAPTHLEVLPRDARAYRAAGAGDFQDLVVGDRPWIGPPWHAWWFARCAWSGGRPDEPSLDLFARTAFGSAADAMRAYYSENEGAYRALLDRRSFSDVPGFDVLDFADMPPGALAEATPALGEAADTLAHGRATLQHVVAPGPAGVRLADERAQAEFVAAMAAHLARRAAAEVCLAAGDAAGAALHLDAATASMDAVVAWDRRFNTPAYAVVAHRMRRSMERHLDRVRSAAAGSGP